MFTKHRAVIFGVDGKTLSEEEKSFFATAKPLGFILFARNIESKQQVKELVKALKEAVDNQNIPLLIDQEGGRVCRLKAPRWYCPPPAAVFGKIAETDMTSAKRAVEISFTLVALDMKELGITVDAAPVLDVPTFEAHDVIGDRAFGSDALIVAALGRVVCETLSEHGLVPIIKHIPGHGRAKADSHKELPVVAASYESLWETDFYPFRKLNDMKWAMTAHVLYTAIDPDSPATFSSEVINVIRTDIGFNGLLFTDCITMDALGGPIEERARQAIEAGCDIILHSRYKYGSFPESERVIAQVPFITPKQNEILCKTLLPIRNIKVDRQSLSHELNEIFVKHDCLDYQVTSDPTESQF